VLGFSNQPKQDWLLVVSCAIAEYIGFRVVGFLGFKLFRGFYGLSFLGFRVLEGGRSRNILRRLCLCHSHGVPVGLLDV
jgi:hypothetical protein